MALYGIVSPLDYLVGFNWRNCVPVSTPRVYLRSEAVPSVPSAATAVVISALRGCYRESWRAPSCFKMSNYTLVLR